MTRFVSHRCGDTHADDGGHQRGFAQGTSRCCIDLEQFVGRLQLGHGGVHFGFFGGVFRRPLKTHDAVQRSLHADGELLAFDGDVEFDRAMFMGFARPNQGWQQHGRRNKVFFHGETRLDVRA